VTEFIVTSPSNSCGAQTVALLHDNASTAHCLFDSAAVYTGAGVCGCGRFNSSAHGEVAARRGVLALWVLPPADPQPYDPAHVWCDMDTAGGSWMQIFSTSSSDALNNPAAGLAARAYDDSATVALRQASQVLLAIRDATGRVIGDEFAVFALPAPWRSKHPSAYARMDIVDVPVLLGHNTNHTTVTLRFGHAAAGSSCDDSWSSWANATHGRLCMVGVDGRVNTPAWSGFATGDSVPLCGQHACTKSRRFTIAVR